MICIFCRYILLLLLHLQWLGRWVHAKPLNVNSVQNISGTVYCTDFLFVCKRNHTMWISAVHIALKISKTIKRNIWRDFDGDFVFCLFFVKHYSSHSRFSYAQCTARCSSNNFVFCLFFEEAFEQRVQQHFSMSHNFKLSLFYLA